MSKVAILVFCLIFVPTCRRGGRLDELLRFGDGRGDISQLDRTTSTSWSHIHWPTTVNF